MKTATYLEFIDNAKEVVETYHDVFGAEIVREHFYTAGMTGDPNLIGKVFHAELKIGDLNLYLCDTGKALSLDGLKFVVEIQDESEARECFRRLVEHGREISGFRKMPYGPMVAQAEDKFGINWEVVIC